MRKAALENERKLGKAMGCADSYLLPDLRRDMAHLMKTGRLSHFATVDPAFCIHVSASHGFWPPLSREYILLAFWTRSSYQLKQFSKEGRCEILAANTAEGWVLCPRKGCIRFFPVSHISLVFTYYVFHPFISLWLSLYILNWVIFSSAV